MLKAPRGIWTNPPTSCSRKVRHGLLICDDCQALTGGFRAPVGCARLCRGGNIMIRTATALIAVLSATAAHCQAQPAPLAPAARAATVQEPSAYCRSGAAILFQGSGDAELAAVQQGCRRGDISSRYRRRRRDRFFRSGASAISARRSSTRAGRSFPS
jgi:hypothetical protein